MRGYRYIIVVLAMLFGCVGQSLGQRSWIERLDDSLELREKYDGEQRDNIDKLRRELAEATNDSLRYLGLYRMYNINKSYCYDSAVVYAERSMEQARRMGDSRLQLRSRLALAFCLTSGGLLSEAKSQLDSIAPSSVPDDLREDYLNRYATLWRNMADYAHDQFYYEKYITHAVAYLDTLFSIVPKESPKWYFYKGSLAMSAHQYDDAIGSFAQQLRMPGVNEHEKAMTVAEMAWAYLLKGDEDQAIEHFARSAYYDNVTSTREITALYHLSRLIYKRGNYERASRYVHQALDDVNFYNTRLRKEEISDILPIIERERYEALRVQRNWLIATSLIIVSLFVVIMFSYHAIRKRNREIDSARELIAGQVRQLEDKNSQLQGMNTQLQGMNAQLHEVNSQLEAANHQLQEADKIKTAYIGRSFYTNAEFIAKLEKAYQAIDRKITTRQYDDLRYTLRQSALNTEREGMYASFDDTFLKLFPHFVERYNALFAEEDRKYPQDNESLTNEMRIFALIRLGINDSERIANFLNYSVHTVNTYKTRIKNRSTADNEQFERLIMAI